MKKKFLFFMYFQYPTLYDQNVVFVCGQVLYYVSKQGGHAERLTDRLEGLHAPLYSPDGTRIAFAALNDLYVISGEGGRPQRITYVQQALSVVAWKDNDHVIVSSRFRDPFANCLYEVSLINGQIRALSLGHCEFISYGTDQRCVIQCHGYGYIAWKRYQGGKVGKLWIDKDGTGHFLPLLPHINHNMMRPLWIGERIYFLSDYEGKGNIYSCLSDGSDLKRHTHHNDFYARQTSAYQHKLIYSCGGMIYLLENDQTEKIPIQLHVGALDKWRTAKDPVQFLAHYSLSPKGNQLALTTRGRVFQATPYKGPVIQKGQRDGVRYRMAFWFKDEMFVALCDRGLEEVWEVYESQSLEPIHQYTSHIHGHIVTAQPHPLAKKIVCSNHKHELLYIDLDAMESHVIDHSPHGPIQGYDWSPCGRWIVYARADHYRGSSLCLYDTQEKQKHVLMNADFPNTHPVFDKEGKCIYFLSIRSLKAHRDFIDFNMVLDENIKLFALILKKGEASPLIKPFLGESLTESSSKPKAEDNTHAGDPALEEKPLDTSPIPGESASDSAKTMPKDTIIDLEDIEQRMVMVDVPARAYCAIKSLKGQILYAVKEEKDVKLYSYDLSLLKEDLLIPSFNSFTLSLDGQWMVYETRGKLRTVRAGAKPDDSPDTSFQGGGWFDWDRITLVVSPQKEWRHMFDEAWRLQRDFFWTPTMGKINWDEVYQRYLPCLDRISSLSELLDIINDLHGELGTSHAYIFNQGVQNKSSNIASLGAEFCYEAQWDAYRITNILKGEKGIPSPLQRPGLSIQAGDLLWSIGGQRLSVDLPPECLLYHQIEHSLPLVVSDKEGNNKTTAVVFPISSRTESKMRYHAWVARNGQQVHQATQGMAGYVHIPDMMEWGYTEFLRSYLQEFDRSGLIIDARFNGGGNLSYLILDLLTRKRLGFDQSRHQGVMPYPSDSPRGPLVALINENTGSDGDIFAHSFRALNLGPLIGKRTWGGVVGIWPRYSLLDGTMTSQPEYSFWFHNVGWRVENYGVDPTIEVDITPNDYQNQKDPQLERAIQEMMRLIEQDKARQKELSTPPEVPCLLAPDI